MALVTKPASQDALTATPQMVMHFTSVQNVTQCAQHVQMTTRLETKICAKLAQILILSCTLPLQLAWSVAQMVSIRSKKEPVISARLLVKIASATSTTVPNGAVITQKMLIK